MAVEPRVSESRLDPRACGGLSGRRQEGASFPLDSPLDYIQMDMDLFHFSKGISSCC